MTYTLQPCSPKAAEKIQSYESALPVEAALTGRQVYPFELMNVGTCFIVPLDSNAAKHIRVRVSEKNKASEKRFIVIKHDEFECLEVARVE